MILLTRNIKASMFFIMIFNLLHIYARRVHFRRVNTIPDAVKLLSAMKKNNLDGIKILGNLKDPKEESVQKVLKRLAEHKGRNLESMLVKRKVPHGSQSRDLEYDKKFASYYRPLVRLHKKKDKESIQINSNNIRPVKTQRDVKQLLLQPFKANGDNRIKLRKLTPISATDASKPKFIQVHPNNSFLYEYVVPYGKEFNEDEAAKDIKHLLKMVKVIEKVKKSRAEKVKTSGESRHLRMSLSKEDFLDDLFSEEKIKVHTVAMTTRAPDHAPFKYWTYSQLLPTDRCPKYQVEIAGICAWIPSS